jgi:molybdopterin biosynthesis enzyme
LGTLIALAQVLAEIAAQRPLAARRVRLGEAAGLAFGETIRAGAPIPARARARRPGYAVAALDLVGAQAETPATLAPPPSRVAAGDALPAGDAILDPDWAAPGAVFMATHGPAPGAGVRFAGEDAEAGTILARAGDAATPARLLALASAGRDGAAMRVPRFTTPEGPAATFLAATLAGWGCARVEDGADLAIVFDAQAAPRLALEPGGACALAFAHGRARLSLAPTPEAAVGALALLHPLVARWTGRIAAGSTRALTRKLVSTIGLSEVALLAVDGEGWRPLAVGDAPLSALLAADAFAVLAPGSEGAPAGAALTGYRFSAPFAPDPAPEALAGEAGDAI